MSAWRLGQAPGLQTASGKADHPLTVLREKRGAGAPPISWPSPVSHHRMPHIYARSLAPWEAGPGLGPFPGG